MTDAERLDWLESWIVPFPEKPNYGDPGMRMISRCSDGWTIDSDLERHPGETYDRLRQAIDAAASYAAEGSAAPHKEE